INLPIDHEGRRLDGALLAASGRPVTWASRWKSGWMRCYQRQAEYLLTMQTARMTPGWLAKHIRGDVSLPPDGAILLGIHHSCHGLGLLFRSGKFPRIGATAGIARDPETLPALAPTVRLFWREIRHVVHQMYGDRIFSTFAPAHRSQAVRKGLRLLEAGG